MGELRHFVSAAAAAPAGCPAPQLWAVIAVCAPQVAILIPFRNRYEHLPVLFRHLIPMLQRQRLQFAFYVVEQVSEPSPACQGVPARSHHCASSRAHVAMCNLSCSV